MLQALLRLGLVVLGTFLAPWLTDGEMKADGEIYKNDSLIYIYS